METLLFIATHNLTKPVLRIRKREKVIKEKGEKERKVLWIKPILEKDL